MFSAPQMFNAFFAVIFIALVLYWLSKERRRKIYRFINKQLLPEVAASASRRKIIIKDVAIVLVLIFSVLALARPQWGFEWMDVKREGLDIFIAIDASKSMLTEDVKPNRLERTKLAVKDLLKKLKGDRVGLIAFSGSAFLACPLTSDYGGFGLSLDDINTATIPRGGTDISKAIAEALKGYEDVPAQYKVLVILTDGENLEGDPLQMAKTAAQQKIRIYTVGIGTREGELVQVVKENGEREFIKDGDGNFIQSRLNEPMLKELAAVTGGAYVRSGGAEFGLDYLYENQLSRLEKRNIESRVEKKYHEHFGVPLAIALLFLLAETLLSARRKYE
ncbi:MAG: VWA domain-containing protein [Candidatus Omnitrophica bacterium]|nr:VWA domain-containing protein [Candidatus Omnitrophota bacterium]